MRDGIARLPVSALRIGHEVAEGLSRMGLRRIGDATVQPDNEATRGKIAHIGYLLQVTEEQ